MQKGSQENDVENIDFKVNFQDNDKQMINMSSNEAEMPERSPKIKKSHLQTLYLGPNEEKPN